MVKFSLCYFRFPPEHLSSKPPALDIMVLSNHIFSAFSFLAFVGCLVPLSGAIRNTNVGVLMYIFWTGLACLKFFIDSIIWDGNAINWAPVWCDIGARCLMFDLDRLLTVSRLGTRIHIAAQIGIPAASLCINRRLANATRADRVVRLSLSSAFIYSDRCLQNASRTLFFDLTVGLGLGLLAIPLRKLPAPCSLFPYSFTSVEYVAQGHRFNIFEDVGCFPVTTLNLVGVLLVHTPPLIISLVSLYFTVVTLINFYIRHKQNAVLKNCKIVNVKTVDVARLTILAGVEAATGAPLAAYVLVGDIKAGLRPYRSWQSIHSHFGRVDQLPAIQWRASFANELSIEMSRWLFVLCGILFFALFCSSESTITSNKQLYISIWKLCGVEQSRLPLWLQVSLYVTSALQSNINLTFFIALPKTPAIPSNFNRA